MKIGDEYVAYCLDEAILELVYRVKNGEKPRFESKVNVSKNYNPGLEMLIKQ